MQGRAIWSQYLLWVAFGWLFLLIVRCDWWGWPINHRWVPWCAGYGSWLGSWYTCPSPKPLQYWASSHCAWDATLQYWAAEKTYRPHIWCHCWSEIPRTWHWHASRAGDHSQSGPRRSLSETMSSPGRERTISIRRRGISSLVSPLQYWNYIFINQNLTPPICLPTITPPRPLLLPPSYNHTLQCLPSPALNGPLAALFLLFENKWEKGGEKKRNSALLQAWLAKF